MERTVYAPAKINLFLDIVGKLENGYHSLAMVMQSVDLCDRVTVAETAAPGITLHCDTPGVPSDGRNIAWRAVEAFCAAAGTQPHYAITIEKRIPAAAGLAGGSADGAAVLAALNRLHGDLFDLDTLCRIGLQVGSDVPFCLRGGTCLAQHTGGVLAPLPPLQPCGIVLVKPARSVSTAEAYAAADSVYLYHPDFHAMLAACADGDFDRICRYAGNVFEQVVDVPERIAIKQTLRRHGASLCQMSGSGPTVFGLFSDPAAAAACAAELRTQFDAVFCTAPLPHGAAVQEPDDNQ